MRTPVSPMNPLDIALLKQIKRGSDPYSREIPFSYPPALEYGVASADPAFRLSRRTLPPEAFNKLLLHTAGKLNGTPFLWKTEYNAVQLTSWLMDNSPDLYRRAWRIVHLGIRHWGDKAEQDRKRQMKTAKRALKALLEASQAAS